MKKILIATDFSANAKHAAEYGYALAAALKQEVVLCNAFVVPAEVPDSGMLVWPRYEYDELLKSSVQELELLDRYLKRKTGDTDFTPKTTCISEDGVLTLVVNAAVKQNDAELVVMGTHGNTGLSTLVLGNHTRKMIDETRCPLLLVPAEAKIAPIKKVALATDLREPERDLQAIFNLLPIFKKLDIELLIAHINTGENPTYKFKKYIENLLLELSNKADYPNIFYRVVDSDKAESGLDWLTRHGQVDILAMIHRKHSIIEQLLLGSHTQKMAKGITIPLLVIPQD
ncbi:MAG TPA: universal stress protein [Mucilaginibacter sp.]|nr:universal stress protein [Mucilaginibacter sp.]